MSKSRLHIMALSGVLMLAGCSTAMPVYDSPTVVSDECGAEGRSYLIGQKIGDIDLESLAEHVRPIGPDDMVTMDYRPDRLNLELDASGIIVALSCG